MEKIILKAQSTDPAIPTYLEKLDFDELKKLSGYLTNKYATYTLIISASERILYAGAAAREVLNIGSSAKLKEIAPGPLADILLDGLASLQKSEIPLLIRNIAYSEDDPTALLDLRISRLTWPAIQEPLAEVELVPFANKPKLPKLTDPLQLGNLKLQEMVHENHFLNNFVMGAAHDLKGPLVVIQAYVELINRLKDEQKKVEALGFIKTAAHKVESILKGLEEMVNLRHKNQQEEVMEVSLSKTFDSVCRHLDYQIKEAKPLIERDFTQADSIRYPKSYVFSILYNLLSNSLKYRKLDTPLEIGIATEVVGDFLLINFCDNGIGIDMKHFGHLLFEPFQRLCPEREGTGLGLCMVHKMLTDYGGRIHVYSELGEGVTFKLYLRPLA